MDTQKEAEQEKAEQEKAEQEKAERKKTERKEAEQKAFSYLRVIRFQETDAAGVVYFANLLSLCHEAFEASLAASGIDLTAFFSTDNGIAVPIVHTEADFHRPLRCGDRIAIQVHPVQLKPYSFEIHYKIDDPEKTSNKRPIATALTTHVCIDATSKRLQGLSAALLQWITATGTLL